VLPLLRKTNDKGCIRGDIIRAMDANATNAVHGVKSAIALASSMNDLSVALVAFNQRNIYIRRD